MTNNYIKNGILAVERMRARGVTPSGAALWEPHEDETLRTLFPDFDAMCAALPKRTRRAITKRCNILGMSMPIHRYTGAEVARLRRMYPRGLKEEIMAAFPHSNWSAIMATARRHGIRRARRPYKASGDPTMDAFLAKLFEIGWYLTDIDDEVRTKQYFGWQNWRRDGADYKKLAKAVKRLGGRLVVEWEEFDD